MKTTNNTIDKRIMQQVIALLNCSENDYNQTVYNCGMAYLEIITRSYKTVFSEINRSRHYWDWWKRHWELRDAEFLELMDTSPEEIIDVLQWYKDMHDPKILAEALYLNGQVLQESYASLIDTITKEQAGYEKNENKTEGTGSGSCAENNRRIPAVYIPGYGR